ncbi:hypothetical protein ACIGEZ_31100 [Streptomyces sp. NPDC085481]|uniref:hypothetical protein n=1 Tax=Streptomyces sp. NPDC085481 TaxID=3365727 RepID=UPI0037D2B5EA
MTDDLDTVAPTAARPGRRRKALTVVLPAVLVLGAVGGGITYTGVTVSSADNTAETQVWAEPASGTEGKDPAETTVNRGRADTPMAKLLLPVPDGYRLGPDAGAYGNDGELGEKEATALLKDQLRGISGKKRREYEKRIDRLGVQGVGVRSFLSRDNQHLVTVRITRMKNKRRIHDMFVLEQDLAKILELPKGPKISGHKNSACFLLPEDKEDGDGKGATQLAAMTCSAYDSELLVSVEAAGSTLDKAAVAALVKKQLDHIKSPGEYV